VVKHKSQFVSNRAFSDGIDTLCLDCNHRRVREYRAKGKRKSREEAARYRERYPHKAIERAERYRGRTRIATPSWLTEGDYFMLAEASALAKQRTKVMGFRWHRDHIVPIGSSKVCGLNVPWNVRVIPAQENWRKATKLVEELVY